MAGPIIYSFHLPKMSGNSSGWPSVALDFIALLAGGDVSYLEVIVLCMLQ